MNPSAVDYKPIPYEILEDDSMVNTVERGSPFRDFLRFVAMRRSLNLAAEYEHLSRSANTEEQSDFFRDMVDLKHNEIECLSRYRLDGRIISLEDNNHPPFAIRPGDSAKNRFSNLVEACHFVMNKELENYCLYLRLADLEEELETRRLFLFLGRLHRSSLNYVKNRLELMDSLYELKGSAEVPDVCNNYSDAQVA